MKYKARKETPTGKFKAKSNSKLEVMDEVMSWQFNNGIDFIKHRTAWDKDYTRWEKGNTIIECNFKAK